MARRKKSDEFVPCPLHPALAEGQQEIKGMLIKVLERQEEHKLDIVRLQDSVENGLKSTVAETKVHVEEIKERVAIIETGVTAFSWFTEWVTDLRTDLFKKTLRLAFYGGLVVAIVWFVVSFGKQSIIKLVGG